MVFPERFSNLPDYAFPRLRKLIDHLPAGGDVLAMTIGEPKHAMPDFVGPILAANLAGFGVYPPNDGTPELLSAIARGANLQDIQEILVKQGFVRLRTDGMEKVRGGLTTVEEVFYGTAM